MISLKEKIKKLENRRLIAIVCKDEGDFSLDYYFDDKGKIIVLKFKVPKKKPIIESIVDVFPNADYFEREIHDFFGVEFEGNTKLHLKLFLPDDWNKKPPMVK
jgi:NADH-quinone oxidoreductase subunit C